MRRTPDLPFTTSADVYDVVYQWLPYDEQAARIAELVQERRPDAATLLEVGCGTGQFLVRLREDFAVEGFDISPEMLDVAASRVPEVALHLGDMRELALGRTFDAVVCLFSSIGYMTSEADLRLAIGNMGAHLESGGVLIVDPWFTPEDFIDGHAAGGVEQRGDLVVARISYGKVEGRLSIMNMHHLVARSNLGVTYFVEQHRMGLFTDAEYAAILDDLGFAAERLDDVAWSGRARWIGTKR